MRDRLIELMNFIQCNADCCGALDGGRCGDLDKLNRCQIETIADHLLANGVIVTTVGIGQTVYSIEEGFGKVFVGEVYEICVRSKIAMFRANRNGYFTLGFTVDDIGKTVFLTREEAERALKGGRR